MVYLVPQSSFSEVLNPVRTPWLIETDSNRIFFVGLSDQVSREKFYAERWIFSLKHLLKTAVSETYETYGKHICML